MLTFICTYIKGAVDCVTIEQQRKLKTEPHISVNAHSLRYEGHQWLLFTEIITIYFKNLTDSSNQFHLVVTNSIFCMRVK
jgi:hypothetical protein